MKQRMISLRLKLIFFIVLLVLVLSTVIVCVSYFTYRNTMNEHYETLGNNVARTAISLLDEQQMRVFKDGVFEGDEAVMQTEEYRCRVILRVKERKLEPEALIDSGNRLREPGKRRKFPPESSGSARRRASEIHRSAASSAAQRSAASRRLQA